jgi:two-component system invasion response regulator UvrY
MIHVLLVDDHALVRTGVRRILEHAPDIEIVGEASSGEEALRRVREYTPDLVLMDVNMPGIGGIETTRKMHRSMPDLKIIALTVHADEPFPGQILDAGASGYLTKGCPEQEMFDAIRTVAAGQRYMGSEVAQKLVMRKLGGADADTPFSHLSQREMQIWLMVAQGQNQQDIAESLCLSSKTVSTYRYRLYEKLNVQNDVELAHLAIRHGILGEIP